VSDRNPASLLDRLTGGATAAGEDPRVAQFVRGVALGALVGAAIAGSTIWGRRRTRPELAQVDPSAPLLPAPADPESENPPAS
jgi:hypothetical protein